MTISDWLINNWIEIFGAITGIIYVFLEIRQNIWLWPVGIITSAVYIIVFFSSKFYADMSLQGYYLVISGLGWYWWIKGGRRQAAGGRIEESEEGKHEDDNTRLPSPEGLGVGFKETERRSDGGTEGLRVTRLKLKTGTILAIVFILLYFTMWFVLSRLTDSPVPEWDSFITSLSIVATWMLARKIYEHWFLWIAVNSVAAIIFFTRDLYPTAILYLVYLLMSFAGLKEWERSL
jgi:nicotinamide mononucleotide transporter